MQTAPNTHRYMIARGAATYGIRMGEIRIFDTLDDAIEAAKTEERRVMRAYMRVFVVSESKRPKEITGWRGV